MAQGATLSDSYSAEAVEAYVDPVALASAKISQSSASESSTPESVVGGRILKAKDLDDPVDPLYSKPAGDLDADLTRGQRAGKRVKSLFTEGHTAIDSLLSNANASVGQVIQVYPHQVALMGMVPALIVGVVTQLLNYFTLWLLIVLYLERKRAKILADTWYDGVDSNGYRRRRHTSQFHNVIGFSLGKYFSALSKIVIAVNLLGTAIAQIVASSSSQYSINQRYNKLQWGLILGAPILMMSFLPSLRSLRIINLIALCGTHYSCAYFFVYGVSRGIRPGIFTRGPLGLQNFFLGAATVAAGGHATQLEMMDVMRKGRKFTWTAFVSAIWNLALLIPHSYALVLAIPGPITSQSNVYAALTASRWKIASVWFMYIHNITAYTIHFSPCVYLWEKLVGVHERHYIFKAAARVPILAVVWLIALAIPFYGTINSLTSSLTSGFSGYLLPCLAFNWYFRSKKRRDEVASHIPRFLTKWNWIPLFAINWFLLVFFFSTYTIMGTVFSVKSLIQNIKTFKLFATCYQCPVSHHAG